jgi:hypothetical protein
VLLSDGAHFLPLRYQWVSASLASVNPNYAEAMDDRKIAGIMSMPLGTVMLGAYRGRQHLRTVLADVAESGGPVDHLEPVRVDLRRRNR